MDRNIDNFCSNIFTISRIFGVNPYFFAMLIALNLQTFFNSAYGNVGLLLKGVQTKNVELLDILEV